MFFNPVIFYISDYRTILNKIFIDEKPTINLSGRGLYDEIIIRLKNKNYSFLKHISCICVTKTDFISTAAYLQIDTNNMSSMKIKNKWYTNISLYELRAMLMHDLGSGICLSEILNICAQFPKVFFEDLLDLKNTMIPERVKDSLSKIKFNKMIGNKETIHQNQANTILFLNDINSIENELLSSTDSRIFGMYAFKMYNITLRIYLPDYVIREIDRARICGIKIFDTDKILTVNNKIAYASYDNECEENKDIAQMIDIEDKLYKKTNDSTCLSSNIIKICYLTCNIDSLSYICSLHNLEEHMNLPSISFLYYYLKDLPLIHKCLNMHVDEKRLYKNLFKKSI